MPPRDLCPPCQWARKLGYRAAATRPAGAATAEREREREREREGGREGRRERERERESERVRERE